MNEIPTPETDKAIVDTMGYDRVMPEYARDLERRLTIARETLNRIYTWTTDHSAKSLAKEILTATEPKP